MSNSDHNAACDSNAESECSEYFAQSEDSSDDADSHDGGDQSENSEQEDLDEENLVGVEPIYPGAPNNFASKLVGHFDSHDCMEKLSGKLIESVLQIIALHCPDGSIVKRTLYSFKTYFTKIVESVIVFHDYCSHCESKNSLCPKCQKSNTSYF